MSIVHHDDWELSEKGKKDAERHQEKIDEAIRKSVKDVIGEESIITKRKGKKVRIPVKGLKDYRFVYGNDGDGGSGVGQGDGEAGDIIGRQKKQGKGKGDGDKAGNEPGHDYMDTEVDIDYLIKIMFDDLGLPYIEEKTRKETLVPKGWKFESISKKGIMPRLHKKRTMMEAIKRMVSFEAEIVDETGCSEDEARRALMQAKGDINDAIDIMKNGELTETESNVMIEDDDMRFKQIEHDEEYCSNAVVVAMMDVSGSMTSDKKYLARSMLFWLVEFLKKCYDNVKIKFITHTTEAKIVDEDTFFYQGESGGTKCASAFEKANYLIDTEFPLNMWNVYCVYIGDGEDWNPEDTVPKIAEMLEKKINMLAYAEIQTAGSYYSSSNGLLASIRKKWNFKTTSRQGTNFYKNDENRFLLAIIKKKEHIWETLKHFLFEKKGVK